MNNNDNNTTESTEKTYFFSERITISNKHGIVANSFEEAEKQYLDLYKDNVKIGKMEADSHDYTVFAVDKNGTQERVY
jgi:hypothetical protein